MKRPRRAMVRPTLAHGVMVLAGLVTFVLVAAALRDRAATVDVLVAATPIEAGTPLEQAPLSSVAVAAGSGLLAELVPAEDGRAELIVARTVAAGEPLLRADLVPDVGATGLRTVALPVERLVIDGLGLRPGDRVDVIAVDPDGSSGFVAVDVGVARLPGEGGLGLGRTAETATTWLTIGVSDQQALDVAAASGRGRVVVVRSTGAAPVGGVAGVGAGANPDVGGDR
jgi:Flp pilus assembly protein CpaB